MMIMLKRLFPSHFPGGSFVIRINLDTGIWLSFYQRLCVFYQCLCYTVASHRTIWLIEVASVIFVYFASWVWLTCVTFSPPPPSFWRPFQRFVNWASHLTAAACLPDWLTDCTARLHWANDGTPSRCWMYGREGGRARWVAEGYLRLHLFQNSMN